MVSELLSCSMGLHEPPRCRNRGYISFCPAKSVEDCEKFEIWENFCLSVNSRENGRSSLSAVAEGSTISPSVVADVEEIMLPTQNSPDRRHSKRKIENLAKCRNDRKGEWSDVRCSESPPMSDVVLSADQKSRKSGRPPL